MPDQIPQENQPRLVLFDFDGTLTKVDSFGAFLWFAVPLVRLILGCMKLLFLLPALFFIDRDLRAERAKALILNTFLGGKDRKALQKLGLSFYQHRLSSMLRPHVMQMLRQYRDVGDTVVVVSASMDIWLQPFCEAERISLICTVLAYEEDKFLGALATLNCNREEKARRIRDAYDLQKYSLIIAYGNSSGDAAMFALAHENWYCHPNGELSKANT